MGFSLKKAVKKATGAVKKLTDNKVVRALNPVTAFGTALAASGVNKASGIDDATYPNVSSGNPNIDRLYDMRSFDYLRDPKKYDFLKDNSQFNALKDPARYSFLSDDTGSNSLRSSAPLDYLRTAPSTDRSRSDSYFNDLIGNIGAPSSVDDVRREVEGDRMRQIMEGLDIDTRNSVGSLKSDFADRGLSAPGVISDIEGNALAQAYSDSNRIKASTRSEYAGKELDRIKEKENALRAAYGTRYGAGVEADTQDANLMNQRDLSYASLLNDREKAALDDSTKRDISRAGIMQGNDLGYADLLSKRDQAYADQLYSGDALWANILNQRDLGAVGQAVNQQQFADELRQKYKEPGLFDKILDKINIGIGI